MCEAGWEGVGVSGRGCVAGGVRGGWCVGGGGGGGHGGGGGVCMGVGGRCVGGCARGWCEGGGVGVGWVGEGRQTGIESPASYELLQAGLVRQQAGLACGSKGVGVLE